MLAGKSGNTDKLRVILFAIFLRVSKLCFDKTFWTLDKSGYFLIRIENKSFDKLSVASG